MAKKSTDFGDIIAKEFKKRLAVTKKADRKADSVVINIIDAGGQKRKVKVIAAGPDSFQGYIGNIASPGFSGELTTFNPDLIASFE